MNLRQRLRRVYQGKERAELTAVCEVLGVKEPLFVFLAWTDGEGKMQVRGNVDEADAKYADLFQHLKMAMSFILGPGSAEIRVEH